MKLSKIAAGIVGIAFAALTLGAVAAATPAMAAGSSTDTTTYPTTYSAVYKVDAARFSATITHKCTAGYHLPPGVVSGATSTDTYPDVTVSSPYIARAVGSFDLTDLVRLGSSPHGPVYAQGFTDQALQLEHHLQPQGRPDSWTCDPDWMVA